MRPDNITGCEIGNLRDPIYTVFIISAVMANEQFRNPIALLTELNALDMDILLADQINALVTVGVILIFRVTANIVQQAEEGYDRSASTLR